MVVIKKEIPLENIQTLAALKTAISIKSTKQLDACRADIDNDLKEGKISETLGLQLIEILDLAAQEQWQQAEEAIRQIQGEHILDASTHEGHRH